MKFSFGGSLGDWWNKGESAFKGGGEAKNFWTGLTSGWKGFKDNEALNKLGNKASTEFSGATGGAFYPESGKIGMVEHNKNWYMNISRQVAPIWEGGLTKPGGSTQDLLDWGEDVAFKSSHALFGTDVGWADDASAATGSGAVANSDAEDPSLINGGNWQRPGEIESALRREEGMRKGTLYHDLAKTEEGRQRVKSLA